MKEIGKSTDRCKDNMFKALKIQLLVGDMYSPHIESKYSSFYFYIHFRYSLPK